MDHADVILISPPARRYSPYLPIGLLCLSSFLEEKGISVRIIHFTMEVRNAALYFADRFFGSKQNDAFFRKTIVGEILARKPFLIGISCCTPEYSWVMGMAREIKERTGVRVVVGGIHATIKPEDFIFKSSPVDYAVVGEGETPLLELVSAIKSGRGPAGLRHLAYLDDGGRQVLGDINIEKDIAHFPAPDYRKVDMRYFARPVNKHIRLIILSGVEIFTSRGCPFGCEFCVNSYLRMGCDSASAVRFRDIGQVIEELKYLESNFHIDGFYVQDDCFLLSKERVVEFCEKLIKTRMGLVWGAETRVNLVHDESLLKLMKRSGLLQLDFGVESGSPAMLKEIGKGITVEQTRRAFHLCKKNGIRTFANIMFNLPHETQEDVCLTERLLDEIKPTLISMMLTVPFLGTKLYEKYVRPGLSTQEYDIYNKNVYSEIIEERFFLASHRSDFKRLLSRLGSKFNKSPQFVSCSFAYWKKVILSRYFSDYLLVFLLAPVDAIIGFFVRLDAVLLHNALRKGARKFVGAYASEVDAGK